MSAPNGGRLAGRTAVVTGGTSGIGRAIALAFAAEGASVVVADREERPPGGGLPTHERIAEGSGTATFVCCDVRDDEAVERLVEATVDRFGGLDVLVNNAGVSHDGTVEGTTPAEWDRVVDVNLTGVFRCVRHAMAHLRESDAPRIVNVASQLGLVGRERRPAYCAAKAGVVNLTRQLALDYADVPVLVNAVCPGVVRTPMTADLLADEDRRATVDERTPLPYFGEPEDVAAAAVFLASDDARFVTGQALAVDGGYVAR